MVNQITTVWVGVTVIPQAKTAHVDAFQTEEEAEEYLATAEEKAEDKDYAVWTNVAEVELSLTFDEEDANA